MATIKDVAQRVGVSITTVSRALNNYSDVNEETRRRIIEISREMNYSPNPTARNLKSKAAKNIALLLSENKKTDANGNIIYRLILGIQDTCNAHGYEFCIVFTDRKKQEQKPLAELCRERSLGGVVIYGLKMTDPYYSQTDVQTIPTATIDLDSPLKRVITVGTDNRRALTDVVETFYQAGRRCFGMINGDRASEIGVLRQRFFAEALRQYGLSIDPARIRYADFFERLACSETLALVKEHPEIDALFFASDLMAIGGLNALREAHISVPDQIGVMGFDGIEAGGYLRPSLSTVWQDFEGVGKRAAECAIAAIEKRPYNRVNYIEYQIKRRDSI